MQKRERRQRNWVAKELQKPHYKARVEQPKEKHPDRALLKRRLRQELYEAYG